MNIPKPALRTVCIRNVQSCGGTLQIGGTRQTQEAVSDIFPLQQNEDQEQSHQRRNRQR
jgi:hypothetical protein